MLFWKKPITHFEGRDVYSLNDLTKFSQKEFNSIFHQRMLVILNRHLTLLLLLNNGKYTVHKMPLPEGCEDRPFLDDITESNQFDTYKESIKYIKEEVSFIKKFNSVNNQEAVTPCLLYWGNYDL